MNDTLNAIALYHGTDKSSIHHNYCFKYQKYLPFKRSDKLTILEIGVFNGSSVKMWKDYFYKSTIVGIDIVPECKIYEENRIHIEIGSQYDAEFLANVAEKHGPFDMILDDGSHVNDHVIFSFKHLFSALKPQGVYVVEDSTTSYWQEFGGGFLRPDTIIEYFKHLVDDVNYRGLLNIVHGNIFCREDSTLTHLSKYAQPDCITAIEYINFLNSIILIRKK